jgi:L-lactate dehydrogenase (cytochrome)
MTITCIEELRHLDRKRVPKMFYDYVDAGSWTQSSYRAKAASCSALVAKRMWGSISADFLRL